MLMLFSEKLPIISLFENENMFIKGIAWMVSVLGFSGETDTVEKKYIKELAHMRGAKQVQRSAGLESALK